MTALVDPELQPSASYSVTIRAELSCQPGTLGRVATVIGHIGGDIDAIQIVKAGAGVVVRDFTVACRDEREGHKIAEHVGSLAGVQVLDVTDRTFELHQGGKIEVRGRVPVRGPDDLSMVYTPGVGRVSLAIKDDPRRQWTLTTKRNMVAVVTDGSAVLGLGNLGPAAAQPVMEGKCINEAMKLAAAEAIAALIAPDELREDYIIPSMFDPRVAVAVARATREAALATGAAGTVRVSG